MSNLQKLGGYALLVSGNLFVAIVVLQFAILAPQGDLGPGTPPDVAVRVLAANQGLYQVLNLIEAAFSITIVLSTLAIRERLGAGAPNRMRVAVIFGSIAAALFLGSGLIRYAAVEPIVTGSSVSAYQLVAIIVGGLANGAIFAFGVTAMMWGWAGLSTRALPAVLCYIILLSGFVALLRFAIPILGLLAVALNILWAFWLGYLLLTQPAPKLAPAMSAR